MIQWDRPVTPRIFYSRMATRSPEFWILPWHHPRLQPWLQLCFSRWTQFWHTFTQSPPGQWGRRFAGMASSPGGDGAILVALWGCYALIQQLWLTIDRRPPSWDPGWHLTGSLNFWWVITHPQIASGEWWNQLLILSSSTVPSLYLFTVPVRMLLGTGADAGVTVNLLYGAMLLGAVYGLGRLTTRVEGASPRLGLWAAGLCLLFPRLYRMTLGYGWDYGAMAWAAIAFWLLTLWRVHPETQPETPSGIRSETGDGARDGEGSQGRTGGRRAWLLSLGFGLALGCTLMTKQTLLIFFITPLLWLGGASVWQRRWGKLLQLGAALAVTGAILWPWFSTNWFFQIGAGVNSFVSAATAEGDPPFYTLEAWLYYLRDLPRAVSWPLLVVAVAGWGKFLWEQVRSRSSPPRLSTIGSTILPEAPLDPFLESPVSTAAAWDGPAEVPLDIPLKTPLVEPPDSWPDSFLDPSGDFPPDFAPDRSPDFPPEVFPDLLPELRLEPQGSLGQSGDSDAEQGQNLELRSDFPAESGVDQGSGLDVPGESSGDEVSDQGRSTGKASSVPSPKVPSLNLWWWYGAYILGGYALWSCISNKDTRYILPYLPLVSLFLAQGLSHWQRRWWRIPGITVGFAAVLMLLNLFPIAGGMGQGLTTLFAPDGQQWPDLHRWPQKTAIATVADAQPYQLINVGLIGDSETVNTHTLTFYGLQQDFRVYARTMGDRQSFQDSDLNSLGWFLTQQDPGLDVLALESPNREQETLQKLLQDPRFSRVQTWPMPDGTELQLFRRDPLPVTVEPLQGPPPDWEAMLAADPGTLPVYLEKVDFVPLAPPGSPVPITYTWVGQWSALRQGLVMLDWQQKLPPIPNQDNSTAAWIHDHGLGLGTLPPLPIQANQRVLGPEVAPDDQWFRVTEHTAMLPPGAAIDGIYGLKAQYLDGQTGDLQPLQIPAVAITIDRDMPPSPSLALDWATELRQLAPRLAQGREGLDPVLDRLGRINIYDPIQNYLIQAEKTLEVRLDRDPSRLDYAYALVLAQVLQRDAPGALQALDRVASLDADNPFPYAYQAFVHLVCLQPRSALRALEPALSLDPQNLEVQALQAVAQLMSGNLWGAWQQGRSVIEQLE